jgi:hypothetical protein
VSEYGVKIRNYSAGSIYSVTLGVRERYDSTEAMLTNSLFLDFLLQNGLKTNGKVCRDVIGVSFNYGSPSYEEEKKRVQKKIESDEVEDKDFWKHRLEEIDKNQDKYKKKSADELRKIFYKDGITIRYPTHKGGYEEIHYQMLYRTPGKAKKGECMFICDRLFKKSRKFLYMGLKLPKHNAPIVEIGAYSSLVTSTIINKIQINPKDILILKDVDSFFCTSAISVEIDEDKHCRAVRRDNYEVKNTMFDGQALIDLSIFPDYGDGYVLLRHHFTKCAAFATDIQGFFKDYFGENYSSAIVKDMWGNEHLAKDIKMITTDNSVKWLKFSVSYEYWCERVHENGCMFGVVKTAHPSKLGNVQRMSYQMVNSLNIDSMDKVLEKSLEYVNELKTDTDVFINFLRRSATFVNDFEVLVALYEQDHTFEQSSYFRERRRNIISDYVWNLKNGKLIQNADNLVIVGSPYAMLLHSVGESVEKDPTFQVEDGTIQCFTDRFEDDEYLAGFRSPHNSANNICYFHNVKHDYMKKYFKLGKLCMAVNVNHTDVQDRANGMDFDSDQQYVTNVKEIVTHAEYCYREQATIVNSIPKETNHYDNTLENFAIVDNKLAASQRAIGESSNLAQICLTYSHSMRDEKFKDYVCILAVLAHWASVQKCA